MQLPHPGKARGPFTPPCYLCAALSGSMGFVLAHPGPLPDPSLLLWCCTPLPQYPSESWRGASEGDQIGSLAPTPSSSALSLSVSLFPYLCHGRCTHACTPVPAPQGASLPSTPAGKGPAPAADTAWKMTLTPFCTAVWSGRPASPGSRMLPPPLQGPKILIL